jgi:heme/copper-type cytochrome/quinol oxidase subunit 2
VATQFEWNFSGGGVSGGPTFRAKVGQTYQFQIRDGDPPGTNAHGFSGIATLGIPGVTLTAGGAARTVTFTPSSEQLGNSFFSCDQATCGEGHGNMVGVLQVVN